MFDHIAVLFCVDDRAYVDPIHIPWTNFVACSYFGNTLLKRLCYLFVYIDTLGRYTHLPGIFDTVGHGKLCRLFDIGIRHNDQRVITTEFHNQALQPRCRAGHDFFSCRLGAGKSDHIDIALHQGLSLFSITIDNLQNIWRQRFIETISIGLGDQRSFF